MENKIQFLNKIYTSLSENASRLTSGLNSAGYECGWEWKENPTSDGRSYPLPVLDIYKLCTVIVDVDVIVLDMKVNRKKLLEMNVKKAASRRRIEIYAFDKSGIFPILGYDGDTSMVVPALLSNVFDSFRVRVKLDKNTDISDIRVLLAEFSEPEGEEK